ncbi:MAG: hypothetical protein R2881_03345 [Eubacteriales bacterium]
MLQNQNLSATPCDSIADGVRLAILKAGPDGIVCAVGSLYMLGEVRSALGAGDQKS